MHTIEAYLASLLTFRFPVFLVAGPLLALALRDKLRVLSRKARRRAATMCSAMLLIELLTTLTRWSFSGFWLQEGDLFLAYMAVCLLILLAFDAVLARTSVVYRAVTLCILPILFYSFGQDYWRNDPVDSAIPVGGHVAVLRHGGGWAGQYWEGVRVVYHPPWFPFLERTLYSIRIGETDECNEKTVHAELDEAANIVVVSCDGTKPYVWERVKLP